jgi:hypothetical protein
MLSSGEKALEVVTKQLLGLGVIFKQFQKD